MCAVALVACGGHVHPDQPKEIPHASIELPPSARNYEQAERNDRHPLIQVKFEMDPSDLILLEGRLPCRLGSIETGLPKQARVDRNEQDWFRPELSARHRGCEVDRWRGDTAYSFLVALDDPSKVVVYAVLAYNWNPHH